MIVEFTPPSFSIIPTPSIPGMVSTGLIFHLYTCVQNIFILFISWPPFLISSPSLWYPAPKQGHFYLPVLFFGKKKYGIFVCLR
jgi:hypothetical protein